MTTKHALRLASGLALVATLAIAAPMAAQETETDQTLGEAVVGAYDGLRSLALVAQDTFFEKAGGAIDAAQGQLSGLGSMVAGSLGMGGEGAMGAFPMVEQSLEGLTSSLDGLLQGAGETLMGIQDGALQALDSGVVEVASVIDLVVDRLPS